MKKLFLTAACLLSTCALAVNVTPNTTASAQSSDFACEYSQTTNTGAYASYGGTARLLTAEEATAKNIPAGYQNEVIVVEGLNGSKNAGVLLDFSSSATPISMVESITFRVYVGADGQADGYPEVRIIKPNKSSDWVMRYYVAETEENSWINITLDANGTNFHGGNNLSALAENDILNKFELSIRVNSKQIPFYIDSVSVQTKANDGVAPVITYNGANEISAFEGALLSLNATAFDEQEKAEKEIEYVWLDENGEVVAVEAGYAPAKGDYTLLLRATDYYGNVAEKSIRVTVKEADRIPPEIMLNVDTVYALTGTKPYLEVKATDDSGEVTTSIIWSQGALDKAGKLTEGTHTLTVVAQDPSGNKTEKVITVCVLPNEVEDDVVVDEEALTPDEPVIPDDSSSEDSSVEDSSSDEPASSEDSSSTDSSVDEPVIPDDSSSEDSSVEDSSSDEPATSEDSSFDEPATSEDSSVKDDDSSVSVDSSVSEEEKPAKKGCGGVVSGVSVVVALCGVAMMLRKKKE